MQTKLRIIAFLLILSSFFSVFCIFASAKEKEDINISAKAFCLIDADSGRVLFGRNEYTRMPMASTTKIMTAIIALESGIPLSKEITVPKEAVGIEGSSIYLAEGEKITLEALIYGLLLSSANDSAVAIAIAVSGSVEDFVDSMNQKAFSLNLEDTHFVNPHGLYDKEHYSSAYDLARILAYCKKNENFCKISGCSKRVFPRDDGTTRVMINHNKLLSYDIGVIAGKTGFTKMSGRCLVSCAKRENLTLICATLVAPDDWNDHKKLYEFGFSNYKRVCFDAIRISIPLISGKEDHIVAESSGVSVLLPSEYADIDTVIEAPRFLFAGLKKGDAIGRVVYSYQGKILAVSPLILAKDATRVKYRFNLFEWLIDLIRKIKEI